MKDNFWKSGRRRRRVPLCRTGWSLAMNCLVSSSTPWNRPWIVSSLLSPSPLCRWIVRCRRSPPIHFTSGLGLLWPKTASNSCLQPPHHRSALHHLLPLFLVLIFSISRWRTGVLEKIKKLLIVPHWSDIGSCMSLYYVRDVKYIWCFFKVN